MIWYFKNDEDTVAFFKTEDSMREAIKGLIKTAEEETNNNEGRSPNWINEFVACKIIGELEVNFDEICYREKTISGLR